MISLKEFLKVFLVALVVFLIAIGAGVGAYKFFAPEKKAIVKVEEKPIEEVIEVEKVEEVVPEKTPLEKAIENSERVNAVFMGIETENRSDVIMFISFDPETSKLDVISIPRDTYYYEAGHESAGQRKINAAYGRRREEGVEDAVENILGVPIHYYASIKYSGVRAIVDAIGGVKVNVPVRMLYDDPTDNPPLHINIQKGTQVLKGNDAVGFLRYRHGNMDPDRDGVFLGGYPNGDLGRVRAQQAFVKSAIQQALSLKFSSVVRTALPYVKTNAGMSEILFYQENLLGITSDKITMGTLPGDAKMMTYSGERLSYFEASESEIEKLVKKLYDVK
ncbi:MAG: LCP family protein [Tissierellales bacterium]|nr:LCP family protein [Tissierellales bacterium]